MFSSHTVMKVFCGIALLLDVAAFSVYALWLISVWCFFAAILSAVAFLHSCTHRRRSDALVRAHEHWMAG